MTKILVIDDVEENRLLLRVLLEGSGHAVTVAENGIQALAAARQARPDLVITDILMPEMDGFALCRALRADPQLATVPLIFYTGTYTDPRDEELALSLGATRFLVKPADSDHFLAMVTELLRDHQAGRLPAPVQLPAPEAEHLRFYNQTLVRKLERKLAELEQERSRTAEAVAALQRSEQAHRALVEHSRHGILRATVDGRLRTANPALARMLGHSSPAELLERGDLSALAGGVHPGQVLLEALSGADGFCGDVTWQTATGRPVVLRLSGHVVPAAEDGEPELQVFAEDVTEWRLAEESLRHAQKMEAIGRLTGGIAHDFNNLLTVISASAEFIAPSLKEGSPAAANLADIRTAVTRGGDLVQGLLGFARRAPLQLEVLDVAAVVTEVAGLLRRVLPETHALELSPPPRGCIVMADRGAVEQVLMNLVTNGRDAMPTGGTLQIVVERVPGNALPAVRRTGVRAADFVRVTVTDQGVGMDEATRERMFDPFFTTKLRGKGTGLGLATVDASVQRLEGFIVVESIPGRGTSVKVHLPVVDGKPPAREPQAEAAGPAGQGELILVVEDEPVIRKAAARALELAGYRVITATDGVEGLEVLRAQALVIRLVVSDLMMPRAGGHDLFAGARAAGLSVPFLFMSGHGSEDSGDGPASVPVLAKPWTIRALREAVRRQIDG